ncbi:MAG: electron transfer flavoprotein subunit beta/FixA family protein [Anaerolineae bacterium]|nr:electron transfer flavoprotein subunit beta/FixA family protein [Anaerolineae bacterium]
MNIITLIKQVPDTAQLSGSVDGLKLMAQGAARIVNPWDEYTLETGIQLKEAHGGKVTAIALGRPTSVEALKTALAMGVDEAVLVTDPALENSDTLATARALVAAIKKVGEFDLIISGRSAIDGNMAATSVQVAALLDIPQISYVAELKNVDAGGQTIQAVRLLERGRETVSSKLPAVISVVKEINEPRYPSFIGIRKAAKATIPNWGLAELGLAADQVGEAGSQARWPEVSLPPVRDASVELLEGEPAEVAKALADRLLAEKVI